MQSPGSRPNARRRGHGNVRCRGDLGGRGDRRDRTPDEEGMETVDVEMVPKKLFDQGRDRTPDEEGMETAREVSEPAAASAVATERPTKRAWKRCMCRKHTIPYSVATERPTKRAWKPRSSSGQARTAPPTSRPNARRRGHGNAVGHGRTIGA